MADSRWHGDALDLDAYLARTGHPGPPEPTAAALTGLHTAHLAAIPFENLEIVLGRELPIDLGAVQAKLVHARRGGYCYEHNLLFAAVLERAGFGVTGLGARIRMGSGKLRPTTHALLRVDVGGEPWITDVGFGAGGLSAPLPLRHGADVRRDGWRHRLERQPDGSWILYGGPAAPGPGSPAEIDLYGFDESPKIPADYVVFNHYTSTHPRSPFTGRTVVQRAPAGRAPGGRRLTLIGCELAAERPDGARTTRTVAPPETARVLEEEFGITLNAADTAALEEVQRSAAERPAAPART